MYRPDYLKSDLSAGLVVYLVALPLCLGIALASGAPLLAGLITGIVAGTIVTWLSGSEVSVSGPAAGLTVIVASGITAAGSYEVFLVAVVLAGLLQIAFGILRTGSLAGLFPNSVITGMLAAIGITIVLKQIPHALGRDSDYEGDLAFIQFFDSENTFTEIIKAFATMNPGILLISVTSVIFLLIWNTGFVKRNKLLGIIPGPLLAVGAGVAVNELYWNLFPSFHIPSESGHLVSLPQFESAGALLSELRLPNFDLSKFSTILSLAITLAVVGSIETLLCLEAGDKIDPYRRISQPNKELIAQGVGNMICGSIGGLPMTSVIVRTSANVYAGSRTRGSAFVHGALLLLSLLFIPGILNKIPLGSLAAVLILVGYKLANVDLFRKMYQRGTDQFVPFLLTIVVVIFTDLLTGVFSGLIASMFFAVKANYQAAVTLVQDRNDYLIRFTKDVSFANKVRLKSLLATIPDNAHLLVDGTFAPFIDRDIFDLLDDFEKGAAHRGINVEFKNMGSQRVSLFSKKQEKKRGVIQEPLISQ